MSDERSPDTRAVTAGRSHQGTSLTPPLWATSTWQGTGLDDIRKRATGLRADAFYSRYSNPTVRAFEEAVADLEGTEDALAFASGMGAIASTVFALCSAGDHIVAQRQMYAGTSAFLEGPCRRLGIDVTWVDGTRPGAFAEAVRPGKTMLVIAESPSNPRLDLVDLADLGSVAGPFTMIDSTLATPLGQQPAKFGVDLVVHSATKGICGHNDATLGVVAGERDLIGSIWAYAVLHGASASPFDALNGLRGIRTLAVRQRAQSASALVIATALRGHPGVAAVHHPGLADHPQHDLAIAQLSMMPTLLAVDLAGGVDAARMMLDGLRIARPATSLGGPETLVCHSATSTHVSLGPDDQAAIGITDGLLRVSVGLEDTDELIADLSQAIPT
ncbi:trans-sulfuration enzyme family protein [Desertimonas flava]|uniref:trans-sulfuration enzyme family protein n=1 Tax=Desertimonas flava TaxID=2064846 RepID=UPI000E3444A2|nr:PLP-dependent aspartate aminotransferase family protein [Desertimonas flava]